jgi:hypothetical protein
MDSIQSRLFHSTKWRRIEKALCRHDRRREPTFTTAETRNFNAPKNFAGHGTPVRTAKRSNAGGFRVLSL